MSVLQNLRAEIKKLKTPTKAKSAQSFFKTASGEYGYGDIFLGLTVPDSRLIAKQYALIISESDIIKLLASKYHEERLIALLILVRKFHLSENELIQKKIVSFYLKNLRAVNNWDLVDLSADKILGQYLMKKPKVLLYKLVKSKNIWERRIAIVSTFTFIKQGQFVDTLQLVEVLLKDKHDLIHKACGWMLREVGKKEVSVLVSFLDMHSQTMPRTMLRYAIERLTEKQRRYYMGK